MKNLVKKKTQRKTRVTRLIAGSVIAGAMILPASVEAGDSGGKSGGRPKISSDGSNDHMRGTRKKKKATKKKATRKKATRKKATKRKAKKKTSTDTGMINQLLQRLLGKADSSLASLDPEAQVELIASHHRDDSQELLDEAATLDAIATQAESAANNSSLDEQTRLEHATQARFAIEAANKLRVRSAKSVEIANQWEEIAFR